MTHGPWHDEVDLVVVGGGVSGLAAAIVAADRGCRVMIVERMKELGGGAAAEPETIAAAGSRFQAGAGIADDPARLADDVRAATGGVIEPELARAVAEQGPAVVAWLADRCGVPVTLLVDAVAPGHSVPRLHAPGERGGATLVADLTRAATRHPRIAVRAGAVAERIVRDPTGAVTGVGVRAERRGGGQAVRGRILIACGGFAADDALVAEHCLAVAGLPYAGTVRATGDALRLGSDVGAATRRLGSCLVTPLLATPAEVAVSAPLVPLGAILVNQSGRRFTDEAADGIAVATAVRAQPGRVAYLVFDERIATAGRAADPFFAHVVLPRTGRRGATLEDLARQSEVDAGALRATVEAWNADRPATRALASPFHAIRVTGARQRTLGGLAVDTAARVLDGSGAAIGGLYAAGGAAAGLSGETSGAVLAGIDTLAALALARVAALDVAAAAAREISG